MQSIDKMELLLEQAIDKVDELDYIVDKMTDLINNNKKSCKLAKLMEFVEKYKNLAEQGTPEWHAARKLGVGGSEMYIVEYETSFYETLDEFILYKCGARIKHIKDLYCTWGNVFENVSIAICERRYGCKIYESGSIPGLIKTQRYSPDGVALMRVPKFLKKRFPDIEEILVLFEFKCPWSRMPGRVIPKHYKPQVKAGLDTIRMCDVCIFYDACYRVCPLKELKFNSRKYNTTIHGIKCKSTKVYAVGILVIKYTDETTNEKKSVVDFGTVNLEEFEKMICKIKRKVYRVEYIGPFLNQKELKYNIPDDCAGYIPYKLMKENTKEQMPKYGYVSSLESKINAIIGIVQELDKLSTNDEKETMYWSKYKYFIYDKVNYCYKEGKKIYELTAKYDDIDELSDELSDEYLDDFC